MTELNFRSLSSATRVLVAYSDDVLSESLLNELEFAGVTVDYAGNFLTAMHLLSEHVFDFIFVSDKLIGGTGTKLVTQVRSHLPRKLVIFYSYSHKLSLDERLNLYRQGVDDVYCELTPVREQLAKLNAIASRTQSDEHSILTLGPLRLDIKNRQVLRDGQEVKLTQTGFQILKKLLKSSPNVVAKQELEWDLWRDEPPTTDVLRSHMYHLRRQLDKPFGFPLIHTIHGHGFKLLQQAH
ncbi:hypothetical protein CWB96_12640 [Pseudoalteromonas citrea]|uniref:DNA-binding response regulator n=1 Tax=Pseudoalteromonas citrea TaxID=43655 RepID=A0A5S3XMZ9_9GAMM|nr:response regulator transcription factor [Pseudoalteromonas citrea]TMP40302.1 hypothetical protein CWB97_19405 [Pseudoalteromonas citrea]TMP57946.1 hypothetical protein CWB96_12640 [Pseudoalteromonas citrea]